MTDAQILVRAIARVQRAIAAYIHPSNKSETRDADFIAEVMEAVDNAEVTKAAEAISPPQDREVATGQKDRTEDT